MKFQRAREVDAEPKKRSGVHLMQLVALLDHTADAAVAGAEAIAAAAGVTVAQVGRSDVGGTVAIVGVVAVADAIADAIAAVTDAVDGRADGNPVGESVAIAVGVIAVAAANPAIDAAATVVNDPAVGAFVAVGFAAVAAEAVDTEAVDTESADTVAADTAVADTAAD